MPNKLQVNNDNCDRNDIDVDVYLYGKTIPKHGKPGQVLTKTENGYKWADGVSDWNTLQDKPFEKIDNKTLITDEKGILKIDTTKIIDPSVINELNRKINAKADNMFYDAMDTEKWYMRSGNTVIAGPYDFGTGGGGGGSTITDIKISAINWPSTIAIGTKCEINVEWTSTKDSVPTGNGTLALYINNNLVTSIKNVKQGLNIIDITKYLSIGTSSVEVRAIDSYNNSDKVIQNITVISLELTSTFDGNRVFSNTITYTYIPFADIEKTVYFIVDGTQHGKQYVYTTGEQQTYLIDDLSHGSHTLKVYFTCFIDGEEIKSNELNYDLIYEVSGNKTPIIASIFTEFEQEQFISFTIPYRVYTPDHNESEISLLVNGEEIQTLTVNQDTHYWEYRSENYGIYILTIKCQNVEKTFNINIKKSDIPIEPVTQNLSLYLTSTGRSNSEAHPEIWNDDEHGIECSLTNFNFVSDGWLQDSNGNTVLKVTGDARVEIPYKVFERDFRQSGKTIELEFSTSLIKNYDSTIISCWSGNRGFYITPQLAKIKSQQSETFTQYKEDDHVRLSFVVEKLSETHLILMYINGIMSSAIQYPTDDNFDQLTPVNISIGSNEATVDLYNIRIYDNNLNRKQIVNNWIYDTQSGELKLQRYLHNDNYNDAGEIVINKLPTDLPYMVLNGEQLPTYKGDKKSIDVQFVDQQDQTRNFNSTETSTDVQGTSSQYYFRKNFKIKFNNGFTYKGETKKKYAIKPGAIEEKTFTFKADVASSESANNVELVKYYQDTKPWKSPAEKLDDRVRVGIFGFPMVMFHNDMNKTYFYGKFNFNNDKGNNDTFGFEDGDESWEMTNNNTDLDLFKSADMSNWKDAFESRYPDDNTADGHTYGDYPEDLEKLTDMVTWVNSTDRYPRGIELSEEEKQRRLEKFRNELEDRFDLESSLFYYLFTELFLMADSRAKNAFPTYMHSREPGDGGDKWFWFPYDMDTAIGINNEGLLVFNYNLEDLDIVDGAYVYNGQESVFWNNIRDAFPNELAQMYSELRAVTGSKGWSFNEIENRYGEHQSKWSESIFNEDSYSKYLTPLIQDGDSSYLGMLQGSKSEQRRWWLYNRFNYLDSKYQTGSALSDTIMMRAYEKGDFHFIPYADIYLGANFDDQIVTIRADRDVGYIMKSPTSWDPHGTDSVVGIRSAGALKEIGDISAFKVGYANFAKATKLQKLIIGNGSEEYSNEHLTELYVGNSKMLSLLDVRNCPNLAQSVDISECSNIEEVYFDNTKITGLKLPVGGILKKLHLPNTLTNITIRNQPQLNELVIDGTDDVETLWLENIPTDLIDAQSIIMGMPTGGKVRLIGFNQVVNDAEEIYDLYDLLDTMKGLNAQGETVDRAQVNGKIYIDAISFTDYNALKDRFVDVQIVYNKLICKVVFMNEDTEFAVQNIEYGKNAYDPGIPEKESTQQYYYTFAGWDKPFDLIIDNTVINAIFEEHLQSYEVSFDLQSTIPDPIEPQLVEYGSYAIRPQDPVIIGATFDGWFTEPGGLNEYDFDTPITDNLTLYAKWTDVTNPELEVTRLTFDSFNIYAKDNIALTGYAVITVEGEPTEWIPIDNKSEINIVYNISEANNYYVWVKDSSNKKEHVGIVAYSIEKQQGVGSEIHIAENENEIRNFALYGTEITIDVDLDDHYENLTTYVNGEKVEPPVAKLIDKNVLVKTLCNPKTYTVKFDIGEKGTPVDDQNIVYLHYVKRPENQFDDRYIIENWYTTDSFETVWDFDNDVVENDMTLYAKWIEYMEPSTIHINVTDEKQVSCSVNLLSKPSTVTISWGDDSQLEEFTGYGIHTFTHEYLDNGEYDVKVTCTSGLHYLGGDSQSLPIITPVSYITDVDFAWNMARLGQYALRNAVNLTELHISKFMNEISLGMCEGCSGLTELNIPNNIISIGSQAFRNCINITDGIVIPDSVNEIGDSAFLGCTQITKVTLPSDMQPIGETKKSPIGQSAFSGCTSLKEINIPEQLIEIPANMFQSCTSLDYMYLNENIVKVGDNAFNGCSSLEKLIIRNSQATIGSYTFNGCYKLETAGPIGSDVNYEFAWDTVIPENAFSSASSSGSFLTAVTLPTTIKRIENYAFSYCSKLTSIELPVGLEYIGTGVFQNSALTAVTLPESLTYIGNNAFFRTRLQSLDIPFRVTSIGNNICAQTSIRELNVYAPDSLNKIERASDAWCSYSNTGLIIRLLNTLDKEKAVEAFGTYFNYYNDTTALDYYCVLEPKGV